MRTITLRTILYFLLLLTSAITLLSRPYVLEQVRAEQLDPLWILSGPCLFGLFFVLFVIDEISKARSGQKTSRLPFAPMVFGLVLLIFLLPSSFREYQARHTADVTTSAFFSDLLRSKDARVRALVMMASSCNLSVDDEWSSVIEKGLLDQDPMVQDAAKHAVQERFSMHFPDGSDGVEGAKAALKNWNDSFFIAKKSSK
jgi:hypothetical protein